LARAKLLVVAEESEAAALGRACADPDAATKARTNALAVADAEFD
jgi:hypothetical protein